MIKIIRTEKSWIEGIAIQQLEQIHSLPDIKTVIGFPDLHAGPVGIAASSTDVIYPHLIGNDIGCGMGFWQTDLVVRKASMTKVVKRLSEFDRYDDNVPDDISLSLDNEIRYADALGTIGGGNHFAELQKVEKIYEEDLFVKYGLDKNAFTVLVHSGSRGLGQLILNEHMINCGSGGISAHSEAGVTYLKEHDYAVKWAQRNRELIFRKMSSRLQCEGTSVIDTVHNSITQESFSTGKNWVHRKGAASSKKSITIIAGSRGSLSYLVQAKGDMKSVNFSLAHGAGRKLKRNEMKARLRNRFNSEALKRTVYGGRVICDDRELLYQEAPQAYKNIDQVIYDLKSVGLIEVIASYQPVITFKRGETR